MATDSSRTQPAVVFPEGFFARDDEGTDTRFYASPRLVTHIDAGAIAAVGELYAELGVDGSADAPTRVLDLMSSWVSHLRTPPSELVVLGLNGPELEANPMATERVVQDLNADPGLPFEDATFDAVLCCVSVDYLTRPVEVLAEAARVLRVGAPLVITFSNRCFPSKAVHGWLATDDVGRCDVVAAYVEATGMFDEPVATLRTPSRPDYRGDPLYAVVARWAGSIATGAPGQPD
ncbi:methyltransferase domain-containing protein [Lapillicoccus sp.]|uniref:class I SAM-dependent methyltransferase n=1 Tax=Lapillicoccus sp. TaxID=1909287 RepID=UPI0025CE3CB4|nr:methyltransferase domain-containing protein [Lapillicoccus sp.]